MYQIRGAKGKTMVWTYADKGDFKVTIKQPVSKIGKQIGVKGHESIAFSLAKHDRYEEFNVRMPMQSSYWLKNISVSNANGQVLPVHVNIDDYDDGLVSWEIDGVKLVDEHVIVATFGKVNKQELPVSLPLQVMKAGESNTAVKEGRGLIERIGDVIDF